MDYVRGDMKVPTATIRKIIDAADQSYKRLGTAGVAGETTALMRAFISAMLAF